MMEMKLQQTADALPEPKLDYLTIEEAAKKLVTSPAVYRKKRRRVALICCIALLLVGCVAGPTVPEYHLYNGSYYVLFPGIAFDVLMEELGIDLTLNSAKSAAEDLSWAVPETLGGSPFLRAEKYNLTTKESHYLTAMLFHHYTYHSIDYGFEMETEITLEDGSPSTASWDENDVRITFGSMDNEVWRRQFGFDEDDVCITYTEDLNFTDTYSLEYEGFTLYVGTRQFKSDFYGLLSTCGQYVSWVDYDHNTVFCIYARDDSPDFAIACAQELIDSMH